MKKVATITMLAAILLPLAAGAWIADGVRYLSRDRRRRQLERLVERHRVREEARRRSVHRVRRVPAPAA